jgi:hypothetical protein
MTTDPNTPERPRLEPPATRAGEPGPETSAPREIPPPADPPIHRRGLLAGMAALVGAGLAWLGERLANAGHDTNIAYDSQTTMHLDVTNTTAGSTRISSNISGTAACVILNNYPVGISRPDGLLGRTTYTTSNCAGVAGANEAASGGVGVLGTVNNSAGTGVFGHAGSSVPFNVPPSNTGVFGSSATAAGHGVVGYSGPTGGGSGTGVRGQSGSGTAMIGQSTNGDGILGFSSGNLKYSLAGSGSAQAHGLVGFSVNQFGVVGVNQSGTNYAGFFSGGGPGNPGVLIDGNFIATGTKSQAVATARHGMRKLYAVEATQPAFEDFGTAWLERGQARVDLDPVFAATVNTGIKYHVFLTPRGECGGLYVAAQDAAGFVVQESHGGASGIEFDYRVMAKVRGHERTRLEPFALPPIPTPPRAPEAAQSGPVEGPDGARPRVPSPRPGHDDPVSPARSL